MEKIIDIYDITQAPKMTKGNKPYWIVATELGNINVFDEVLIEKIKTGQNKRCKVDIVEKGKYTNITEFIEVVGDTTGGITTSKRVSGSPVGSFRTPEQLIRIECVNSAIETLNTLNNINKEIGVGGAEKMTIDEFVTTIISKAKEYEEYIE